MKILSTVLPALIFFANVFRKHFSLIFFLIAKFPKNAPVQSHAYSHKNPTIWLPPGKDVRLARLAITNQVKRCDIIACCTPTIQMLDNLVRSSTNFQPMLFLQKHTASGINHPLPTLTKSLSYVSPNIFKQPLNHTRIHFQTLPVPSNPNLHNLFGNQCQSSSQIHYPLTLFMAPLFAIFRNLNSEVLPSHLRI